MNKNKDGNYDSESVKIGNFSGAQMIFNNLHFKHFVVFRELCTFLFAFLYHISFVKQKTFNISVYLLDWQVLFHVQCTQLKIHSILLKMLYHCRYSFAHETHFMHWIIFFWIKNMWRSIVRSSVLLPNNFNTLPKS